MKINRLLEITLILLNKGTTTAGELADRFQVSSRTIYRDIDILSSAGVPLYMSKGNGGGISLLKEYSLNRALISQHESESLLLALKTLQAAKYPEIDTVLDKLGAVFKKAESMDWVHIDFSPWGSRTDEQLKFKEIKRAILERRIISFAYVSSGGERSLRQAEPMQLIFKSQAWYLWAYCRERRDFRTFRISRMKNVIVSGEGFQRRKPEDNKGDEAIGDHEKTGVKENQARMANPVKLVLKFYPPALYRLYDDFDDENIIKNSDGTYSVVITFPEDQWVYGYIMSYGPGVEVIEPPHIRRIIADMMRETLKLYSC